MAIIGYARVSTTDQSVDRQLRELQEVGADRIYADTGVSGAKASRPELDRMLDHLRKGDEVVVTELSRIARNTQHLLALMSRLEEQGVTFRCLNQQGVDYGSATGKLLLTIMGAVAQMERDLTVERINSGLASARAKGRVGGRPKALDSAAVAKAKDLQAKGVEVPDIAKTLGVSRSTAYKYLSS
jgi:DNA invertase Pin-like site-specific DNA recombinase